MPFLVVALMLALIATLTSVREGFDRTATTYSLRAKEDDMVTIAEALELYAREKGAMPPSLAALAATPGYEYLGTRYDNWQGYAISPVLNDGTWQFTRTVVYTFDRSNGMTDAEYLAKNTCGSNAFAVETGRWCGDDNSRYYVVDSRKYYKPQLTTARIKLTRLSQKFADYYNSNSAYPSVDASGSPLGVSSITSMAALAGYSGNAKNCSGTYQYQGIPIDCNDMFDLWGGRVGYQFEGPGHVIFVSEPPIFNAAGARVVVAVDRM